MIKGATSRLAAALGWTGREAVSDHQGAKESLCAVSESIKACAEASAGPVESVARARPRRRSLPTRVRKGDPAMLAGFMGWLHVNEVSGEIRAGDLFRCYCEFAQQTGAAALTPRQLAIALGAFGIRKRRLRVRNRTTGRVVKLASGVPVRATRYDIPDQAAYPAVLVESSSAARSEFATTIAPSGKIERAA